METMAVPAELFDPISGEVVETSSIDQLADAFERLKEDQERINAFRGNLINAIAQHAKGDTKTQRIRGERRTVKVEAPDTTFDQSVLKELWNSYGETYAREYLRIDRVAVNRRELNKLRNTTATVESLLNFQKTLLGAESPAKSLPYVTVEKDHG